MIDKLDRLDNLKLDSISHDIFILTMKLEIDDGTLTNT
jgi:hypothetical protein